MGVDVLNILISLSNIFMLNITTKIKTVSFNLQKLLIFYINLNGNDSQRTTGGHAPFVDSWEHFFSLLLLLKEQKS